MGLFDHFPYTNVHELNLDWVLSMMKALKAEWEAFTAGNSLTFADPLQHDASKTYAKNTIVIDGAGNAYVSLQAVPVGVGLGNQDYWLMVFDYEAFIEKVNKNFTARYYRGSYRATAAINIGDWLTVDDVLCKATAAIAADDALEVGVNIDHFTLEDFIKAFMTSANQLIQQYKNDIDNSELQYRNQLAQDIANTTASLQNQLNLAISGVTVDSEVINARVGWDNTTYPTLRDAIVGQITDLHDIALEPMGYLHSSSGVDFNNLTDNRYYYCNGANIPNAPETSGDLLLFNMNNSTGGNTIYTQICISMATGKTYSRRYLSGSWSSWAAFNYEDVLESTAYRNADNLHPIDFNSMTLNRYYYVNGAYTSNAPESSADLLLFNMDNSQANLDVYTQICHSITTGRTYCRWYIQGAGWGSWTYDLKSLTIGEYKHSSQGIDFNTAPLNQYVFYNGANIPHAPETTGNLFVFTMDNSVTGNTLYTQICVSMTTGRVYTRLYQSGAWGNWSNGNFIKTMPYKNAGNVGGIDFDTFMPTDSYIYVNGSPTTHAPETPPADLLVFTFDNSDGFTIYTQIVFSMKTGKTYTRHKIVDTWSEWYEYDLNKTFELGTGKEYTTFYAAATAANAYYASTGIVPTVKIYSGTYDLVADGSAAANSDFGMNVYFNIIGCQDAILKIESPTQEDNLSILNMKRVDCTIENITLDIKDGRYCIHDEQGTDQLETTSYYHKYKNLVCVNRGWSSGVDRAQRCFGIGLGGKGLIDIEDCVISTPNPTTTAIDAHSAWSDMQDSYSIVKVHGCLFPDSTVSATSHGSTTDYMNKMLVYNNKMVGAPFVTNNDTTNIELVGWNNTTN